MQAGRFAQHSGAARRCVLSMQAELWVSVLKLALVSRGAFSVRVFCAESMASLLLGMFPLASFRVASPYPLRAEVEVHSRWHREAKRSRYPLKVQLVDLCVCAPASQEASAGSS